MRRNLVGGLVLAALVIAAAFAISARQNRQEERSPGGQRVTAGRKTIAERTTVAPASEGRAPEASVEILVTGDPGVRFRGEIETPNGTRSIEGTVPQAYPVAVSARAPTSERVTAKLRKEDPEGTLEIQVLRDGRVVTNRETSARGGFTRVTWSPPERHAA